MLQVLGIDYEDVLGSDYFTVLDKELIIMNTHLRLYTFDLLQVLGMDYEDVLSSDDFTVLEMLLAQSNPHRFALAKDYLKTGDLSDAAVRGDHLSHSLCL